jgi:hypothetical protein
MVRVSVEVRKGAVRFGVTVRAESFRRAMSIVEERYPNGNVRVKFPLVPEGLFGEDVTARAGMVEEKPKKLAA